MFLTPTYHPYAAETEFAPTQFAAAESAGSSMFGTLQALQSFTPTHRKMVRVLAEAQEQNHIGLQHSEPYSKCSSLCIVTSMATFNNHVAELSSHHLMVEKRARRPAAREGARSGDATDFADYWTVPKKPSELKRLLEILRRAERDNRSPLDVADEVAEEAEEEEVAAEAAVAAPSSQAAAAAVP